MTGSLARQIARRTSWLLVGALLTVGIATASLLHAQHLQTLDHMLLTAAHASAHPAAEVWDVESSPSPITVLVEDPSASTMPREWVEHALDLEAPLFYDRGDERLLLLVAEIDLPPELQPVPDPRTRVEHEANERHFIVSARAQRVTLAASVGPFLFIYLLVSLVAAGAAAAIQRGLVRASFRPLERARAEVAAVVGPGQGARLTEGGPDEMAALLRATNDLLDRLDLAAGAQARFTAHAAHELRTPVTIMLGEVEVALRRARSVEEYRQVLVSLREEIGGLQDLVGELMDLARLDAETDEPGEPGGRTDVGEVVRAALDREQAALDDAGCTLEVSHGEELGLVRGNATLLGAALGNLLRNSAVYAAGSVVALSAAGDSQRVTIIVDDGGPGVPEADREAVFDRLVRGSEARSVHRTGLGLGLPLAREVARRYGGDCVLEGAPGGGCRVRLTLHR